MSPPILHCTLATNNTLCLAAAVGVPVLLGYFASSHVRKYKSLYWRDVDKPRFMPPVWVYAPTWTTLYSLMGYASYLIYQTGQANKVSVVRPLAFYSAQLVFNLCWPALFFRYRNLKAAFYAVTLTLILSLMTTYKFNKLNSGAAQLMFPYLAWLAASSYLNKLVWSLNESNPLLATKSLFNYPSDEMVAKANLQSALNKCALYKVPAKKD